MNTVRIEDPRPLTAVPAPPPHRGFLWAFRDETESEPVIGKAVRMASGIRAAMALADLGHVAECGTILRTVPDFANEIVSVCEGVGRGNLTQAQRRFVQQHFAPMPATPSVVK